MYFPVTETLRSRLTKPARCTWREWGEEVGLPYPLVYRVATGRQGSVRLEVYRHLGLEPPLIPIDPELVRYLEIEEEALAMFLELAQRLECQACGRVVFRLHPAQKYCYACSPTIRKRLVATSWRVGPASGGAGAGP